MKSCAIALATILFSFSASAEMPEATFSSPAATNKAAAPAANSSVPLRQGLRVAFVKPVLKLKMRASQGPLAFAQSEKLDSADGISVGYAYLPIQSAGYTTNFAIINLKEQGDDSMALLRADANLAYTVNPNLNFKGGFNLSSLNKSEMRRIFKSQLGLQASAGYQFNRNFGVDVGYVQMSQAGNNNGVDMSFDFAGPEVSLTGTF